MRAVFTAWQPQIDDDKGPLLDTTIRAEGDLKMLRPIDLDKVRFVGEALTILRNEAQNR